MQARLIDGGVTTPAGFTAAGVYCGIKKPNPATNPLDLCLIASTNGPVPAAAVFTTNLAIAAPIVVSRDHLLQSEGLCGAAVINSGCANACTGEAGMAVAKGMAAAAARAVGCGDEFVFVSSTGVIGVPLSLDKVKTGVAAAAAALSVDGGTNATRAIMTTDPFPKSCAAVIETPRGTVTVGGMAKGSGMIEPRMATMLGFLTTDAKVSHSVLQGALRKVCDETFNAITVDGECSTNDCVLLMASGASGIEITDPEDPILIEPLRAVAGHLAREIVRGGEGATKLVTVRVTGAASPSDAWLGVRTICNSPLVKTAINGGDPNWGRLIAAAGRSGAQFVLDRASVSIGDVDLFVHGVPFDERADAAATVLQQKQMTITVDLGTGGHGEATMWTCDFSAEVREDQRGVSNVILELPTLGSKDFLSILNLTPDALEQALALAAVFKSERIKGRPHAHVLNGQHVALLFEKPSLRTHSAFTIAVRELGGDVIEPSSDVAFGGRESASDVARNLERWVPIVVVRTFEQARLERFAAASNRMRVINALTDEEHPCQALADMQALIETWGSVKGRTIAFVGDGNNVAASLAQASVMLGMHVRLATPAGFELNAGLAASVHRVARFGATFTQSHDPIAAVAGVDAVYTDAWASMGQEDDAERRVGIFQPFQVNAALMAKAGPGALFMHCLPAHRGHEVTDEVIDSPASIVFDQSENRLHTQKALLAMMSSR